METIASPYAFFKENLTRVTLLDLGLVLLSQRENPKGGISMLNYEEKSKSEQIAIGSRLKGEVINDELLAEKMWKTITL